MPPMAGLQLIAPIVSMLWVSSSVRAPARAEASAASVPAWPPPTTITSCRKEALALMAVIIARCAEPHQVWRGKVGTLPANPSSAPGEARATRGARLDWNRGWPRVNRGSEGAGCRGTSGPVFLALGPIGLIRRRHPTKAEQGGSGSLPPGVDIGLSAERRVLTLAVTRV